MTLKSTALTFVYDLNLLHVYFQKNYFSIFFYRFHSLRKRASFQHSYKASTAEAKIIPVGGAIRDVITRTYVGISIDGTVKSLCASSCFKSHSEGISPQKLQNLLF